MFYKVKTVQCEKDYILKIGFDNGETRLYNVGKLFERWEVFRDLQTIPGLFECVKVDAGGYGISWNDDLDLDSDELYYNGEMVGQIQ